MWGGGLFMSSFTVVISNCKCQMNFEGIGGGSSGKCFVKSWLLPWYFHFFCCFYSPCLMAMNKWSYLWCTIYISPFVCLSAEVTWLHATLSSDLIYYSLMGKWTDTMGKCCDGETAVCVCPFSQYINCTRDHEGLDFLPNPKPACCLPCDTCIAWLKNIFRSTLHPPTKLIWNLKSFLQYCSSTASHLHTSKHLLVLE